MCQREEESQKERAEEVTVTKRGHGEESRPSGTSGPKGPLSVVQPQAELVSQAYRAPAAPRRVCLGSMLSCVIDTFTLLQRERVGKHRNGHGMYSVTV